MLPTFFEHFLIFTPGFSHLAKVFHTHQDLLCVKTNPSPRGRNAAGHLHCLCGPRSRPCKMSVCACGMWCLSNLISTTASLIGFSPNRACKGQLSTLSPAGAVDSNLPPPPCSDQCITKAAVGELPPLPQSETSFI